MSRLVEELPLTPEKNVATLIQSRIKQIIESLLFASNVPLPFHKLREISDSFYPVGSRLLRQLIEELQSDYIRSGRAFRLEEIAHGFILRSTEEFGSYIRQLQGGKKAERLSIAAMEVLAIIAYKQPITRVQIESIRGVDCSGVIHSLIDRQLIQPQGRLEAPGRPTLYGVTKDFLFHFGLKDLTDLPPAT